MSKNNDAKSCGCQQQQPQINPHALDSAQDTSERFEVMHPPIILPKSSSTQTSSSSSCNDSNSFDFDPYKDRPIPTSTYAARAHVHKNALWHCSVHIWLVDPSASAMLLQKRSLTKDTFPGRWDISSAGHVEAGKGLAETARLELSEELGVDDVKEAELTLAFVIPAEQAGMGGCNAYEHVYFLVWDRTNGNNEDGDTSQFALGTAEVSEVVWMPVKEVLFALRSGDDGYAPCTRMYVDVMEKELAKILGDGCLL